MQPLRETRVTFPSGGLIGDGEVLAVVDLTDAGRPGALAVVTDTTPFHPVDPAWPDQPGDTGTVVVAGAEVAVLDTVLGATQGQNLLTASNIPVRPGEPGWTFVVEHVIASTGPVPAVGQYVQLQVDGVRRAALSDGHTACHLAALALDAALADRWRKPVPRDSLGSPNFDELALTSSRIVASGSVDVYRIGKSLRKKGFLVADVSLDEVAATANELLAGWVAGGAAIAVEAAGPLLTDRRSWVCRLPQGTARIPCGGTHPTSLAGMAAIEVELATDMIATEWVMDTKVTPHPGRR